MFGNKSKKDLIIEDLECRLKFKTETKNHNDEIYSTIIKELIVENLELETENLELEETLNCAGDIIEGLTEQNLITKMNISILDKLYNEQTEAIKQYQMIIQYQDFYIAQLEGRVTIDTLN